MQSKGIGFKYLSLAEIVEIHDVLIERHGGSTGIKDIGLVESALMAPQQTFGGELLLPTLEEQCARLWFGFVQNHGFVDGNKRVGFAAANTFLRMNKHRFRFGSDKAEQITVLVASSRIDLVGLTEIVKVSIEPL